MQTKEISLAPEPAGGAVGTKPVAGLVGFLLATVKRARLVETPFPHLEMNNILPDDVYKAMIATMPESADFRPMSTRRKTTTRQDGTPTRFKIDLLPEQIWRLPAEKRKVWGPVGRALCSAELRAAFVERLTPGIEHRLGPGFSPIGFFPIPILTRDIPGYAIQPHTDTHRKAITVQIYLPRNDSIAHVGTVFHERIADGSLRRAMQLKFSPNTGYAFAPWDDTWHSVDPVGPEVETRDSILLTYFHDARPGQFLFNRAKRAGTFLNTEFRRAMRR
jgi:hypothetical protein